MGLAAAPSPRLPPPEALASTERGNGHRARQLGAVLSHSATRPFASRGDRRAGWGPSGGRCAERRT
eukprot:6855365-Prymnesium_polylepis.1